MCTPRLNKFMASAGPRVSGRANLVIAYEAKLRRRKAEGEVQLLGVMRTLLIIASAVLLTSCASSTRTELARISVASDPASLTLVQGYNDYVRRAILTCGTEAGIIRCRDGSSSRFWFRSHHLTGDIGGTLFRLSDGTELFMSGWFCCEVQLPEQQLTSLDDLRAFVGKHHGVSP